MKPNKSDSLPKSLEAEKGVLGSVLLNPECLENLTDITAQSFFHPAHQKIWASLKAIHEAGKKIDLITLTQNIEDSKQLDQIGGVGVLADIQIFVPTALNVQEYADTIREKAKLREVIRVAECIRTDAYRAKSQTAHQLAEQSVELLEKIAAPQASDSLVVRRFDLNKPPEKAEPRIFLKGQGICAAGNLMVITGQAKAGKSALVGAILSSMLDNQEHLSIGMAPNHNAFGVIHFDTEQSRYDHYQLIVKAMNRAAVSHVPDWIRSYSLADLPTVKRRQALASEMTAARREHHGIQFVIIDGVADLIHDPNDPKEAFALVEELHRLAIRHDTPIIGILHLNPGSDFKTRGHLGSQLERKAESVIALEREKNGEIVTVYLKEARHGYLPKDLGPRFAWDQEMGRHELVEGSRREAKAAARRQEELPEFTLLANKIVEPNGARKWGPFIQDIMSLRGATRASAERIFTSMRNYGIIEKDMYGFWGVASNKLPTS
jgi:hypothetical protein